jgi:hypothetical protein
VSGAPCRKRRRCPAARVSSVLFIPFFLLLENFRYLPGLTRGD